MSGADQLVSGNTPPPIRSAQTSDGASSPETGRKHEPRPTPETGLRVLLLERDSEASEQVTGLLHGVFGDRCRCKRITGDKVQPDLTHQDKYDILLFVEGPRESDAVELVRSCASLGWHLPIVVFARDASTDLDLAVIEAGAAECVPIDELTPGMLKRAIRHALLRQQEVTRARTEIESLSSEITRLNMLREASHGFVDNACHDFRSPLTVIKEFASIIAEGLAGEVSDEQAEFLEIILTRVDQLSQMVDAILDASRLESDLIGVQREEHAPAELIENAQPTLEQQASSHGVAIRFSVDEDLPNVFADAESVGRILVNLVTNAAKFTEEGGEIDVWARHDPANGLVKLGVTDNGPGIAPEHVKVIFDRFKQVDGAELNGRGGFGLGLHIASELARVNFGSLSVESEPQKGSTFAFTLPVFDVDTLIPLHFGFLKTSRHRFRNVSIATVTAAGEPEMQRLAKWSAFSSGRFARMT